MARTTERSKGPTMHRAVRVNGTRYVPAQADELAEVLDAKQVAYLTELGAISGFSATADAKSAAGEGDEDRDEPKAAPKTTTKKSAGKGAKAGGS